MEGGRDGERGKGGEGERDGVRVKGSGKGGRERWRVRGEAVSGE